MTVDYKPTHILSPPRIPRRTFRTFDPKLLERRRSFCPGSKCCFLKSRSSCRRNNRGINNLITVMDTMMFGRVEDVLQRTEGLNRLGVYPKLVQQVKLLVGNEL